MSETTKRTRQDFEPREECKRIKLDMEIPQDLLNTIDSRLRAYHDWDEIQNADQEGDWQRRRVFAFLTAILCIIKGTSLSGSFCEALEAAGIVKGISERQINEWFEKLKAREWQWVLDVEQLKVPPKSKTISPSTSAGNSRDTDLAASAGAWSDPFIGHDHQFLIDCITRMNKKRSIDPRSERSRHKSFTSIVQSSGMGKSRLVDQVAKEIFTLPFNLRLEEDKSGYPEADAEITSFCTATNLKLIEEGKIQFLCLFEAIFNATSQEIAKLPSISPGEWREKLGNGSSPFRSKLYGDAVANARKKLQERIPNPTSQDPFRQETGAIKSTVERIQQVTTTAAGEARSSAINLLANIHKKTGLSDIGKRSKISLFMYFDEAHCLHDTWLTHASKNPQNVFELDRRTAYYAFLGALDELRSLNIFSLFLSTTSHIFRFAPSKRIFASARSREIDFDLQAPITEMPFDLCEEGKPLVEENKHTLEEISELEFMCRFGRPLFSSLAAHDVNIISLCMDKLALRDEALSNNAKLAIMSIRLQFEFEPRMEAYANTTSELVANHMRVVFSIPKHRLYMYTGTPSEPILAEAAARQMLKLGKKEGVTYLKSSDARAHALGLLAGWVNSGLLEKGELGELVARTLLTFAHDLAIEDEHNLLDKEEVEECTQPIFSKPIGVEEFLSALLRQPYADNVLASRPENDSENGETLGEAFKDAFVHFTHFGRTLESELLTDEAALYGFCRAMAWTFHRTQQGVDIGIPVFKGGPGTHLNRYKMTMIFIQVKNRSSSKELFIDIESYKTKFFSIPSGGADGNLPYIVIVMNLGLQSPPNKAGKGVSMRKAGERVQPDRMVKQQPPPSKHPRYAFAFHGCSSLLYKVIDDLDQDHLYAEILDSRVMLSEHPRQERDCRAKVLNLKPNWGRGKEWFGWAKPTGPSRVLHTNATHTVQREGITFGSRWDSESDDVSSDDVSSGSEL